MLSEEVSPPFTVAMAPYPNPGDELIGEHPTLIVISKDLPQPITPTLYHRDHLKEIFISSMSCLFNTTLGAFFLKLTHGFPTSTELARSA
jgi:hypothetical protein